VADYLESLRKVRELAPRVLYPTHGPPISNPLVALESFEGHRLARIEEVREARLTNPDASPEELARIIYGKELPDPVAKAAKKSAEAIVHFLDGWDEEREAEGF
jgi:hydroxyacylglutathione hydrolase